MVSWIILGDFNAIKVPSERIGNEDVDYIAMEEFNNCIEELDLKEHSE